MSQHDFDIANQTATNARADINDALQALASLSAGASAPATTYANMLWYDSSNNILKMRSEADDAWINIGYVDQSTNAFRILDNTQIVNTSGTQTGLLGDQATSAWETGTDTTESLVSPAKVKAAIDALSSDSSGINSVQSFTSSGTWTKPTGVTKVMVYVTGAGGATNTDNPSKGGAGGTAIKFLDVSSISSSTITVGSGSTNGYFPGSGGLSRWSDGTNTITGNGGGAGGLGIPGSGGTATGGDLNITGGEGQVGPSVYSGASSYWGGGPNAYGSGSDGRRSTSSADGLVYIVEYK